MAEQSKILFESRFNDATPAASSTATGFDVLNLIDYRSFSWWKPASMPATITVDCGSAQAADYCAIWGHDLNATGCELEVRGSTDNFAASDVLVASVTPADDKPVYLPFVSASYRYWRITVKTGTPPTIAIALLGVRLSIPSGVPAGFDPIGRDSVERYNRSVNGHPLGKVIEFEEWQQAITFELLSWAWIRSTWLPAWSAHLRAEPFLFAWHPDSYASELHLCSVDGKFTTPHSAGALCSLTVPLTGLALEV